MANQYEARYDATHSGIWDANDLAAFLVTTIPLIIALFQLCRPLILKILLLGGLVSYLLGIVATQSRGGFIGILAVGTCYIIKSKRKLLSLTLVGVLAVAMYAVMPESPLERFFSISISERQSGDSIDERIEAWKRGLSMGKDHPLFGVGVGCFSTALGTVYHLTSNPDRWITAHNSFILILAEVGIPAFLCYLGIYYLNFKDLRIIRRHLNNEHIAPEVKKEVSILSNTFGISLIAFAVTGFFLSHTYTLDMFLIMAFIIVLKRITERLAYEHQPQNVSG